MYRTPPRTDHACLPVTANRYAAENSTAITSMLTVEETIDNDWTDLLIGITHAYPFSKKLAWTNQLDGGFGGSEGTLHFNTALQWRVAKSWNLSFAGDYRAVDFENASEGASDWYLYDVDEFGFGLGFAYIF